MNVLELFAGAGGGILGGLLHGWRTVCAVEIDPFCREVLMRRQLDGVWDLLLAVTQVTEHYDNQKEEEYWEIVGGLWIEVKKPSLRNRKRGGLTVEQEAFENDMARQGYATAVCYTTQEILDTIEGYLTGRPAA